ncbi:MAG: LuxR C-terminal-related transcriptional regulator [Ruthenibacterium lactatiformans]
MTTVRYHIKNIYQKLEVNNKVLAIKGAGAEAAVSFMLLRADQFGSPYAER